ncbi:MAG: LysM peptidoglycan-binding domain-containing protein [Anaerolineae bacterium]|nr:LysM peptidoglycan-binding domain-containing protein [Anaerolineae bacterium]MDW8068391.1 LysM peptidoglycan-binding domain-containing protein [Anaerolineae bacterium]
MRTLWTVPCAVLLALVATGCGSVITPPATETPPSPFPTLTSPPPSVSPVPGASGELVGPSPTPTITPTPIIYVVREGDTLSGIAATYGVSVEALQRINNIQNPLFLRPGQTLIIPTGREEAMAPTELLPTPTPMPFGIRGVGFYETPVGSLHCLGEVVNTTAEVLTNVQVRVTLFDASGNALIGGNVFAAVDLLPPAARAPFSLLFTAPPPNFVSHQVVALRGEAAGELAARYVPMAIEEVTGTPYGPHFEISGAVRNRDPERIAATVIVVATTYDETGLVTGFRQQRVDVGNGLAPGAAVPFQMRFTVYKSVPADFAVIAYGKAQ